MKTVKKMSVMEIAQEAANSIALGTPLESVIEKVDQRFEEGQLPPHPLAESLERNAGTLERNDERLARHRQAQASRKISVVRRKNSAVNRDAEESSILPQGLVLVPTNERCGYTIEKFPHPIDKSLQLYQVHRDGRTLVLNESDFDALNFEDDGSFEAAMDLKFLETNAGDLAGQEAEDGVSVEFVQEPLFDVVENEDGTVSPVLPDGAASVYVGEKPELEEDYDEEYWDARASQARGEMHGD